MSGHPLPPSNSPTLHLVEASPEELLAQQHAHFGQWGGALTKEAYLRREKLLFSQELTSDGNLTPWMLVAQEPGSDQRQVVCGCESLKKRALVRRGDGSVEVVTAYGIASVFCPEPFRRRGYAARMMEEVGKRLRSWHVPDGQEILFSILYSDIGKHFYAARGWHPFESAHVSLPAPASSRVEGLPSVRLLRSDDLAELCAIDEESIRQRLLSRPDGSRTAVALLPDHQTLIWHHVREQFIADELHGRQPEINGAVVGEPGSRVWCYWTRVWTNPAESEPNTLYILRLAIEDPSFADFAAATTDGATAMATSPTARAVAALLAAAQDEAARWDMKQVHLWNPSSTSLAAAQILDPTARVEDREEDSIASLLWYGEGSHRDVEWLCNEKFGWC